MSGLETIDRKEKSLRDNQGFFCIFLSLPFLNTLVCDSWSFFKRLQKI